MILMICTGVAFVEVHVSWSFLVGLVGHHGFKIATTEISWRIHGDLLGFFGDSPVITGIMELLAASLQVNQTPLGL